MEKKFYKANNDQMFKAIFCNEKNRDLLEKLLEEALEVKVNIISLKVPEQIKDNIYVKGKTLDMLIEAEGKEINIEVNTYSDPELHNRNAGYICGRYANGVKTGESYARMPDYIQINLTVMDDEDEPEVSLYELYDIKRLKKYINNLKIYEFNLRKIKKVWYNNPNKFSILSLLDCGQAELENVKGDALVKKLSDEVKRINNDEDFVKFMSDEEEDRHLKNTFIDIGIKQGFEQGISQGIEYTAKMMLEKNVSIDDIMLYTGLSKERIEGLKN